MASNNAFAATSLTGGGAGALDDINHDYIEDGDFAFVADHDNEKWYVYTYDAYSSDAESSPDVIIPDSNTSGTGVWKYIYKDVDSAVSRLSSYLSLSDAVSTIGATETELWVDTNDTMTGNVTIPSTIILRFLKGNTIDPNSNTLTIYSPANIIASPGQKIFEESVTFTKGGLVHVGWWGATRDGSTDDYTAINCAHDSLPSTGGVIQFQEGTYILGTTLVVGTDNVSLLGYGQETTVLKASHSSGAVVHFQGQRPVLEHMGIDATSARQTGGAGSNWGILVEPPDVGTGNRIRFLTLRNFRIENQPNTGLLIVGGVYSGRIVSGVINLNDGHGIEFNDGTDTTGRTDDARPGLMTLDTLESTRNDGNSLVISTGDYGLRFTITNCDFAYCAESAGTREVAAQVYVYAEQVTFIGCAFHGRNIAGDAASTGGIYLSGESISLINCRYLNVDSYAVYIDDIGTALAPTSDIKIIGFAMSGDYQSALDPAIQIDSSVDTGAVSIDARTYESAYVTSMFTKETGALMKTHCYTKWKNAVSTVNNTTTYTDIDDLSFEMLGNESVSFEFLVFYKSGTTPDIKFRMVVPTGAEVYWGTAGGTHLNTAGSVAEFPVEIGGNSAATFGGAGVAAGDERMVKIVGTCETTGTEGTLKLQFAQATADASDTSVLSRSNMKVWV